MADNLWDYSYLGCSSVRVSLFVGATNLLITKLKRVNLLLILVIVRLLNYSVDFNLP